MAMSEAQTVTLTDFLLARIAEDEAAAQAAMAYEGGDEEVAALPEPIFRHIVRNGPARVLAECEAKRRIVEGLTDAEAAVARVGDAPTSAADWQEWGNFHAWRNAADLLALPYADHEDFQEEWRV